jgi:alpha-L-rhamnosidase
MRIKWIFYLVFLPGFTANSVANNFFQSAEPVWPSGMEKEKNLLVGFRAIVEYRLGQRTVLRVAASSLYRFFSNGTFVGHGPARGPHGHFRVDEWDLGPYLRNGKNLIALEVAGYNIHNYYLLNQPSFLQAEILTNGSVLASTAGSGVRFEATVLKERIQKVQRYSFQRTFTEMYRIAPGFDHWRTKLTAECEPVETSVMGRKRLLPRGVPYPQFRLRQPLRICGAGRIEEGKQPAQIWKDRSLTQVDPIDEGFAQEDLREIPSITLQKLYSIPHELEPVVWDPEPPLELPSRTYKIFDLGTNLTGFIGAEVTVQKNTRLFFTFDELLTEKDVDFKRLNCANYVSYQLEPGSYTLETIEPYTLRYLKAQVTEGECRIDDVYLREYANPDVWRAAFAASDVRLNRLFEAGRETYRQNALDIFMDCPSRERAGWLCDSFFTSRVALDLSGKTQIEANFFENYSLPTEFPSLKKGMLPMCYPADHPNGRFIPNWALWFVLELEEYLQRSGDLSMASRLQTRLMELFEYFEGFENRDGLLEGLESWVFIEWSAANQFVQDVNYPSNMLYAAALDAAGRLYSRTDFAQKANRLRRVIREQSFDGEFFVDNAIRSGNELRVTRNRTEVCQYFAFYFDVATPQSHPKLHRILISQFGPKRVDKGLYPEIQPANSFVGNVLRMELLSRWGLSQQLLAESVAYFLYMAERTGTLWENITPNASCNHGFASHVVHLLYRDVLGFSGIDPVSKSVRVRFAQLSLDWCEGRIPLIAGPVSLRWRKESGRLFYRLDLPSGFRGEVENFSGLELIPE